jgi:hypothetical protein
MKFFLFEDNKCFERLNKLQMNDSMDKQELKQTKDTVKEIWRTADCVCFDVDSTVCQNEAIDDLALFLNVGEQVKQL